MNGVVASGIVLTRTDYQESDRILTVLTADHGKVSLMARGARKSKSKLAGGIELFTISDITFLPGKGRVGTLISSRLKQHFPNIVKDIDRTMFGYDLLKKSNKVTEDAAGPEYFDLLSQALAALDSGIDLDILALWFCVHLLKISGHEPDLQLSSDSEGISKTSSYKFDQDTVAFVPAQGGNYTANHVKLLRLTARAGKPEILTQIQDLDKVLPQVLVLVKNLVSFYLHI